MYEVICGEREVGGVSIDIEVRVTHDRCGREDGVVVALGGDCELTTIIEALSFIVKVLDEQRREIE